MSQRIGEIYNKFVDSVMEKVGCVTPHRCIEVFGSIPFSYDITLIRPFFAPYQEYAEVGELTAACNIISAASAKGQKDVTFQPKDLGVNFGYSFQELQRLQQEAQESKKNCLIADMKLKLVMSGSIHT
jgi:hypothetical protein